jgi:hydroxyacylglutathione hydrolase
MKPNENGLTIKQFSSSADDTHQYLLIHGGEAAVIDAGEGMENILKTLEEEGCNLKYLLVTHGHKSHMPALTALKSRFGGAFCMHKGDLDLLPESTEKIDPDLLVKDKERLRLGGTEIQVLHTPGHTRGALCFYVKSANALFSGNTLMKGKYGNIFGPNGMRLMMMSLRRLYNIMPAETVVYPWQGPTTTFRDEAWMFCLNSM